LREAGAAKINSKPGYIVSADQFLSMKLALKKKSRGFSS